MTDPISHDDASQAVRVVVNLIADTPDIGEHELVEALERAGYSHLYAEKLCVFVPSAFTWALLRKMGLKSFPSDYIALDATGAEISLPISQEHYFTAALELAFETLEHGWSSALTKSAFEYVIARSAEMGATNQLLASGQALEQARLLPLRVMRISAEEAREA